MDASSAGRAAARLLPLDSLTVLTTDKCTAQCAHCCMNSSPRRRGRLALEDMLTVIEDLAANSSLRTVIFAGGEPTLLKSDLLQAISLVRDLGLNARLVTNASWAVTPDKARAQLQRLRQAGLNELNISADDFHLPFIPFERVVTLWQVAKEFAFVSVSIANCSGPDSLVTPEWIMERIGERPPLRFDEDGDANAVVPPPGGGTYYSISNARAQRLGRGDNASLGQRVLVVDEVETLNRPCPFAGRSVALAPDAHMLACCGFEFGKGHVLRFGSTRDQTASEALAAAYDSVVLNVIASIGPYFLMRFIQSVDPQVPFKARYGSICEICQDATRPEAMDTLNRFIGPLAEFAWRAVARREDHERAAAG